MNCKGETCTAPLNVQSFILLLYVGISTWEKFWTSFEKRFCSLFSEPPTNFAVIQDEIRVIFDDFPFSSSIPLQNIVLYCVVKRYILVARLISRKCYSKSSFSSDLFCRYIGRLIFNTLMILI